MTISRTIKDKGLELGYEDIGICPADPFEIYIEQLTRRSAMYAWTMHVSRVRSARDYSLLDTANPARVLPGAKSIIVGVNNYFKTAFPESLEGKIGRLYQAGIFCHEPSDYQERSKDFRAFLKSNGFAVKFAQAPARLSGARAGVVGYGNNCFVYANRVVEKSSWVVMDTFIVDKELEYDEPTLEVKCPANCRKCLDACPTGALYAPLEMDPRKCIAFQTYNTVGAIPLDVRGKMGAWIYGCDVCQDVCPRNNRWLRKKLPPNESLYKRASDFALTTLIIMNDDHYHNKVWPLLDYIRKENRSIWQRNAAVAIGNRGAVDDIPVLAQAMCEKDPLVRRHVAWALGKIKGGASRRVLETSRRSESDAEVSREIDDALERIS